MIVRALGAVAAAMVGLAPLPAAAGPPGPSSLPSALADPVESGFTEVNPGADALEGYFDANAYARLTAKDSKDRQQLVDSLNSWGFVTGYGREWYMPGQSDWLGELVIVLHDRSEAQGFAGESKLAYARDAAFQSFFDMSTIPSAYGLTETTPAGFHWSIVIFTKENDVFAVERGSSADFMTAQGKAQAQRAYDFAPAGTSVVVESAPVLPSVIKYVRPLAVVVLIGSLISGAVLATLVFVIFSGHFRPRPALEAPPTP